MRRRDFILTAATAFGWVLAGRAEQPTRTRRVGVLMSAAESDALQQANAGALVKGLKELGWRIDRDLVIDFRWGASDSSRMQAQARELVGLGPDALLVMGAGIPAATAATQTIPIVCVLVSDPVAQGLAASLAHPGGNTTGFTQNAPEMSGKWLELLRELAPDLRRVAFVFDPDLPIAAAFLEVIRAAAGAGGMQLTEAEVRSPPDIDRSIASFAEEPHGGLIIGSQAFTVLHRDRIIELARRYRLPAVYPFSLFTIDGGLVSYGLDEVDEFYKAATYVDRILKGTPPGELPFQQPTKFRLIVNLKTAKALDLTLPAALLARADQVIE